VHGRKLYARKKDDADFDSARYGHVSVFTLFMSISPRDTTTPANHHVKSFTTKQKG
jgi:hypothetical protein